MLHERLPVTLYVSTRACVFSNLQLWTNRESSQCSSNFSPYTPIHPKLSNRVTRRVGKEHFNIKKNFQITFFVLGNSNRDLNKKRDEFAEKIPIQRATNLLTNYVGVGLNVDEVGKKTQYKLLLASLIVETSAFVNQNLQGV